MNTDLTRPLAVLLVSVLLGLSGCSSSGSDPDVPVNPSADDNGNNDTDAPGGEDVGTPPPDDDPEPAEPPPEPPAAEPTAEDFGAPTIAGANDAALPVFAQALQDVSALALVNLNRKLQSGEAFTEIENNCLGSFDPALGEALLAIDCGDNILALDAAAPALQMSAASMAATSQCTDSMLGLNGDECRLINSSITVPIEWIVPAEPPGRPVPNEGGIIGFNVEPDVLELSSLPGSPTVIFQCKIQLSSGVLLGEESSGDCTSALSSMTNRLNRWLDGVAEAQSF